MTIYDDGDMYVCISHQAVAPCISEGAHLISNWKPDVDKILKLIKEKDNG